MMLALYLAVAGVVTWTLTESAARLYMKYRGRYFAWQPFARTRLEIEIPALPQLDPVTHFEVNSIGERGDEPPAPTENYYHAIAMGGSAVECYMLDQKTEWPHQVQIQLNRPDALKALGVERVHVGNIGRSLMACGPLCTMLDGVLRHYESVDMVFMMVGSSDVVAWTEQGGPANYTPKEMDAHAIFRAHPLGPFSWNPLSSAFRRLASAGYRQWKKPVEHRQRVGKSVQKNRDNRAAGKVIDTIPDPSPMLEVYRENLTRLITIARKKAKRVLVVHTPWVDRELNADEQKYLWNFGIGKAGEVQEYFSYDATRQFLKGMDRITHEVADELGTAQVELRPHLDLDFETFYDELHLTPKGCREVGKLVADAIVSDHESRSGEA
ncbi:MAG: lysophospholipase L1-like esterase [Glaciecola sp.]|jgi:lysophospholipase L1-like esterase